MYNKIHEISPKLKELICEIPKAELHCHIDSIPAKLLLRFADRNKVSLPFSDVKSAEKYIWDKKDGTLESFLEIWKITLCALHTEEDFYDMVIEFAKDAKEQNIIYREAMFSYFAHANRGVALDTVVNGLSAGWNEAKKRYDVDIRFIANIDRTIEPDKSFKFIKDITKYKEKLPIVSIGLDCAENGYPAYVHKEAFKLADKLGFYKTAHCGEDAEAYSVWDCINNIRVDRIDHGFKSDKDEYLMDYLAEKKILLTMCPTSNMSSFTENPQDYPFKLFMEKGIKICVNSDDPPYGHGNLIDNFCAVTEYFNLSEKDIITLAKNAFEYNYCGKEYLEQVNNWIFNWEQEHKVQL